METAGLSNVKINIIKDKFNFYKNMYLKDIKQSENKNKCILIAKVNI